MKYFLKIILQKFISYLPRVCNYFFQKKITKTLPPSNEKLKESIEDSLFHYSNFEKFVDAKIVDVTFFEFGAGWNLVSPLIYYSLGINRQIVVDIIPHIRFELINHAIEFISQNSYNSLSKYNKSDSTFNYERINSLTQLLDNYGINYYAPVDLKKMEYENDTFDFISTSATLEHIPPEELIAILLECKRVLKVGGVMSHIIKMSDDFGCFPKISRYNFFKYSDTYWRLITSKLNYKNRLRYTDYLRIFNNIGLKIVEYTTIPPNESNIRLLGSIKIHRKFKKYNHEELGTHELRVVLKK